MIGPTGPVVLVSGPSAVGKSTVAALCAQAFERGVHLQADHFISAIVSGFVQPSLPEAAAQNEVIGVALAGAATEFPCGGYTVVVDGHTFPAGAEGFAYLCGRRDVAVHYAVLRADLATCVSRASQRAVQCDPDDVARVHGRFADLAHYEAHVIDATPPVDTVAEQVLARFHRGDLRVRPGSSPR